MAVSTGNVMRCSASSGEIAGRLGVDLHLDVGDVRHRVDRQPLVVVDAEHRQRRGSTASTSQRCAMENWRMRSIMPASRDCRRPRLVVVRGAELADLRLDGEAVGGGVPLARP